MPVPRRFDRRPPERDSTRINDRIRVPEVRLIGEDGKQIGVIKTSDALAYAQQRDLDLVEVAAEARPPVCRVLDYSKYKYEQAQKQKAARKHQQQITIREIKFRPKIAQNDYDTKKGHVTRFLLGKDKVKITIMFRGREVTHPERGVALLNKLAEELGELAVVEQNPLQDGRNMTMMLAPSKAVLAGETEHEHAGEAPAEDHAEPEEQVKSGKGKHRGSSNGHKHADKNHDMADSPLAEIEALTAEHEEAEAEAEAAAPAQAEAPAAKAAPAKAEKPAPAKAEKPAPAAEEPAPAEAEEPAPAAEPAAEEAPAAAAAPKTSNGAGEKPAQKPKPAAKAANGNGAGKQRAKR